MQSFGAIIYFAFFLSDWFIAHSNIPKGLNTPYAQVRLHGHFEKPGLWGFCYSAPDRTGAHLQTAAFPLFPARHTISFISPQSVLWKLVPKCNKMPAEHRAKHTAPVQSVEMSTFSHPAQVSQHGTILHLQRNPHSQHQITRIMVNGNKRNWEKMPGF